MRDYFIIGFGLSGMALAARLEAQGKTFQVFENYSQKSSRVAGGILNPVNLKRFKMAWQADKHLETAVPFYQDLQRKLNTSFLQEVPVYRRFTSIEEQNNWFVAADKVRLAPFLNLKLIDQLPGIRAGFSFGKMERTQLLDTQKLFRHFGAYLKAKSYYVEEKFDYSLLKMNATHVEYKGEKAHHVIFSEGMGVLQNPFFKKLPIQGNKGEYIIIKADKLKLNTMLKASVFILPLGNDLYKVGATYDREAPDQSPSEKARKKLQKVLKEVLDCSYEIVDQVAGIRPTLPDRRPVLGRHSTNERLWICNGFGSRGVLFAPTASEWLLQSIQQERALPIEVDVKRFSPCEN